MSKALLIMGSSGSGKTTSMRTLDPKTTYYVDADRKGLSWKGWKEQYNQENKNYIKSSDAKQIEFIIKGISDKRPDIKTIVVDTINTIMWDDEFKRMSEKNYDKWSDLASSIYGLITTANTLRDDLIIIFTAHTQTDYDESGYKFTHVRTSGRKLDKIVVESKFTTVLYSKGNKGKYVFETQANDNTAKSPLGAFDEPEIDNDITKVIKALEDF